ncbi:dipeptidase [Sphingoaurantiacus capsulatus]|uniref:Dipeptidase n=1 Tax=Sphingoaurantiacus capsulatus TaxID=1771310 RepID=A0ABV7X5T4_9SPHN
MNRREALGLLAAAPFALAAGPRAKAYSDADFARAIVIDGLGSPTDPEMKPGNWRYSPRGIAEMKQSGLTAVNVTVGEVGNNIDAWNATLQRLSYVGGIIDANPDLFLLARRAADIREAKAAGKVAVIYGLQDTAMVGSDLDRLRILKSIGVRSVQLTYNLRNLSGDGSLEPDNAGLSKLGRETIEKIEAEKLLLDLSHGGRKTIVQAIEASKRPLAISHTGCRALNDNPRNVDDASMKAAAEKGGVVGIYWMPFLVASGKPDTADLIRHMDHALNVVGEDHLSIGTDGTLSALTIDDATRERQRKFYEGRAARGIAAPGEGADIFNYVHTLNSHLRFRMFADALSKHGWPAARIDKVLGGNLLRLYGEAWGG